MQAGPLPSPSRARRIIEPGQAKGPNVARMGSGKEGGPPVLRHLRMPDEKGLADAAAEILKLQ